jgi:hypothetical protein
MGGKWSVVVKEVKTVSYVAAPMVAVTVLQYLLQVVSVMMVGHLDQLSLSGVSIATSFATVTGFSLLVNKLLACFLFRVHACQYVLVRLIENTCMTQITLFFIF